MSTEAEAPAGQPAAEAALAEMTGEGVRDYITALRAEHMAWLTTAWEEGVRLNSHESYYWRYVLSEAGFPDVMHVHGMDVPGLLLRDCMPAVPAGLPDDPSLLNEKGWRLTAEKLPAAMQAQRMKLADAVGKAAGSGHVALETALSLLERLGLPVPPVSMEVRVRVNGIFAVPPDADLGRVTAQGVKDAIEAAFGAGTAGPPASSIYVGIRRSLTLAR
jgi:hypothetical protein